MRFIIALFLSITALKSEAQEGSTKALNIKPLTKIPKSLFLIKQAKVDNDVGEPVIYPSEKQSKLIKHEKVFNKYRLEVLEDD